MEHTIYNRDEILSSGVHSVEQLEVNYYEAVINFGRNSVRILINQVGDDEYTVIGIAT